MKKFIYLIFIILTMLTFSLSNEINNVSISNSYMLSSEQSVTDNHSFNAISNPAMLAFNSQIGYLLEYNKLFYYAQSNFDSIGFLIGKKAFGIVINNFSSGKISIKDIEGINTGQTIDYSLTSFNFAAAIRFTFNKSGNLAGGITGIVNWERINVETITYDANFGLVYNYENKNACLRLGTVIKNISSKNTATYHCGVSIKSGSLFIICGYENKFINSLNEKIKLAAMLDLPVFYSIIKNISFGVGYLFSTQNYIQQLTFGLSINFKIVSLNYSFATHQYLGSSQNFRIGIEL